MANTKLALFSATRPATVIADDHVFYSDLGDGVSVEVTGRELKHLALRAIARYFVNPHIQLAVSTWKAAQSAVDSPKK